MSRAWIALAALGVAALLLLAWRLWRRRRLPRRIARRMRRAPAPRYPVVLAHGLFGFDQIRVGFSRQDYFRGVPARLQGEGWVVHRARVASAASVATRADELAAFIRDLPGPRVNVVAHSMGGLDARYALARLGLADRVASLTTVGTPHLGTPVADLGEELADRARLRGALERMGLRMDALRDLTTERMAWFNREVPDVRGVAYGSVVAVVRRKRDVNPLLLPTYLWLAERGGENDGMVPAASQRWGEVLAEIEADHWAQIGWSRRFDAAGFYADLLRELRGRGF
ncbi:MAG TPA: alpha/beta fold hydrolase [Anaeromyxobacteraceae bacterium]|nr:alpha/beta fold hydrolase [Anaeromyxobacteraceae bacterium]